MIKQSINSIQPTWPSSAKHMDRIEAAQVIKHNLINNCCFKRFDWGSEGEIAAFGCELNSPSGDIAYYIAKTDAEFGQEMKFRGMSYWCRGFDLSEESLKQNGVDAAPSKTDGIIDGGQAVIYGLLLNSAKNKASYLICLNKSLGAQAPDPDTLSLNAGIIDELNLSHHMVEKLVDGYMSARKYEVGYKLRRPDRNIAELYLYAEIFGIKYGL